MILASSARESEGGFTPPPLKRARLSPDALTGGPSSSDSSSIPGTSTMQQSDLLNCKQKGGQQRNGVINELDGSRPGITNGYNKMDDDVQQNGDLDNHLDRRRKRETRMTTMEKDVISLIGQHLRENGYR